MSKIRNYTSGVPVSKSIEIICKDLASVGTKRITQEYDGFGEVSAVYFIIQVNGNDMAFRLPANVEQVSKVLTEEVKRPRDGTVDRINQQAARTAWKIVSDWVSLCCTLGRLNQVELQEVFFPYVLHPSGETLYSVVKSSNFKMLNSGR